MVIYHNPKKIIKLHTKVRWKLIMCRVFFLVWKIIYIRFSYHWEFLVSNRIHWNCTRTYEIQEFLPFASGKFLILILWHVLSLYYQKVNFNWLIIFQTGFTFFRECVNVLSLNIQCRRKPSFLNNVFIRYFVVYY